MTTATTTASEIRTEQHGSFELALSARNAFPLFSPEGERIWVPGWDPKPIFPLDEVVRWQTDSVFTLRRDGDLLTWWIIEVNHDALRASYVHFDPNRVVRVTVQVESTGERSCRVNVTYLITATTVEGRRHVTGACTMDSKMSQWKQLIEAALQGGDVPPIVH